MVHTASNSAGDAVWELSEMGGGVVEVESDETFIGGKAKNMHASRRGQFEAECA